MIIPGEFQAFLAERRSNHKDSSHLPRFVECAQNNAHSQRAFVSALRSVIGLVPTSSIAIFYRLLNQAVITVSDI